MSKKLDKLDQALDEYYTRQISFWLRVMNDGEENMLFWERKRQALRHD